jgi:hypothetical protein
VIKTFKGETVSDEDLIHQAITVLEKLIIRFADRSKFKWVRAMALVQLTGTVNSLKAIGGVK